MLIRALIQNKDPVRGKFAVSFVGKEHLKVQILLSSAVNAKDNKTMAKAKRMPRPNIFVGGEGNEVGHNCPLPVLIYREQTQNINVQ